MVKNIFETLKSNALSILVSIFLIVLLVLCGVINNMSAKPEVQLKDFKDGIQNHLVWGISGKCFFVRPNSDVTVYLIPVADCDRK